MGINWSKELGAPLGTAAPGSANAQSLIQQLQQMNPEQQQAYVDSLQNLTDQQKQALLDQLRSMGQGPPPQGSTPGAGLGGQPFVAATAFSGPTQGAPQAQQFGTLPTGQAATGSAGAAPLYTNQPPPSPDPTPFTGMSQDEAWQYATTVLGYDAKAAYQSYLQGFQQSASNLSSRNYYIHEGGAGMPAQDNTAQQPNAWLQQTITASEGQWGPIIDFYANAYAQETGQTMTAATRQQLAAAVQAAAPEARSSMLAEMIALQTPAPPPTAAQQTQLSNAQAAIAKAQQQMQAANTPQQSAAAQTALATAQTSYNNAVAAYQSTSSTTPYGKWAANNSSAQSALMGYIGTGGFLYNMFSTAVQSSPNLVAEAQQASILKAFQAVGMTPTPADYTALSKATPDEVQQYLLTQPLPSDPKIPYGVYQATKSNVDALYLQYFGSLPTQDQLMGYMGMNSQQIQDHIMGSQSKQLPGATVGRYAQLRSFADSAVSAIGYGVSDQVIAAAHQGMQKP